MPVVNDIDRPDVNGIPPKMAAIGKQAIEKLGELSPVMTFSTDDNLMSSVQINGSLDPKTEWNGGIFQNSRYFQIIINTEQGKRYYSEGDKVTARLIGSSYKIKTNFRKYTSTPDKVIAKIEAWILAAKAEIG